MAADLGDHFQFPQRWQRHDVKLKSEYRGSSKEELQKEAQSSIKAGRSHAREKDGRSAGQFHGEESATQTNWEQEESRVDEEVKDSRKDGQEHVWNVRELKQTLKNHKLEDPKHHAQARFVLQTTEDHIKNSRGVKQLKAEAAKAEAEKKGDEEDKSDDKKQPEKQDRTENNENDKEEKEKPRRTPAEDRFLKQIVAEMEHLSALKNSDGKTHAPLDKHQLESTIDEADQFSPDSWIPRSSSLIRLTGQFPLNAECDLSELFDAGLITPTRLHYVRNHGAVPYLDWDTHKLSVFSEPEGLLQPQEFSMEEIANMDWINIPVSIACDGNRRGEVNMIKRSKGFSWGSGGVSCVYWKGVLVRDLLLMCGLADKPADKRWYLHYEGADAPSEGKYATSIPLEYAMSPENDVMLAYQMNDKPLHPDHGYPLRSIIPGYVGGRQVKWLSKIWVSDKPSTNHYHIWDNRVLPEYVTEQESDVARAFYHHPDTACYEQNLNSVVVKPAHGETFHLDDPDSWSGLYTLRGYAYDGGGVAIQKVEVSLDEGNNWLYAFRRYPDNPMRHGHKFWTWCHWFLAVPKKDLLRATSVSVRAWNVYKNTQPDHITWNLMGMMNNSIHKVKPSFEKSQEDRALVIFNHPTQPGPVEGGWMKLSAEEKVKASSKPATGGQREFTLEEIAKHNKQDDAWIILDGNVYDVTSILEWHPGGQNAILSHAGKAEVETTTEYASIHDGYANGKRDECLIGKVSEKGLQAMQEEAKEANARREKEIEARKDFAIRKHRWSAIKLIKKTEVSPDVRIYRFELPKKEDGKPGILGLPIGNHVAIGAHFVDSMVVRHYTPTRPILPQDEDGTMDLLVKVYYPDPKGKFPPGGTIGNYLDSMNEGEEIDCRGPLGEITYEGNGKFMVSGEEKHFKCINLIAGGSGITPHYQLIHAICSNPSDSTKIRLIVCDRTKADILLFDELQQTADKYPDELSLWIILSHPDGVQDWKYGTGHLNKDKMKEHLYPPADDTATFLCGPPTLIEKVSKPALNELGYADEQVFGF